MSHARPAREVRTVLGTVEVRGDTPVTDIPATDPIPVKGHAAVFDQRTVIGSPQYGFLEVIERDAFSDVLKDDARYLLNHDPNKVMARVGSGTLRLSVDKVGLVTEADLAPVSYARDLAILLDRQDVTQMSFAFRVGAGGDTWRTLTPEEADEAGVSEGFELRTVVKVERLYDVSAVTYPAYEGADVALRAAEAILGPRQRMGQAAMARHATLEARKNAVILRYQTDAALDGRYTR